MNKPKKTFKNIHKPEKNRKTTPTTVTCNPPLLISCFLLSHHSTYDPCHTQRVMVPTYPQVIQPPDRILYVKQSQSVLYYFNIDECFFACEAHPNVLLVLLRRTIKNTRDTNVQVLPSVFLFDRSTLA